MASRKEKTTLRNNLESIAIAIVAVLLVRQMVVEAFKIPTGSMAPTLVGVHKEARCENCGRIFSVGKGNARGSGTVTCPNCRREWQGVSPYYHGPRCTGRLNFRWPGWLWNQGYSPRCSAEVTGTDAANRVLRGGSRIFVNKFLYWFRKPRRWEVIVFRYPYVDVSCPDCGWDDEVRVGEQIQCDWCDGDPQSLEQLQCPVCGTHDLRIRRKNYIKRLVGLPGETVAIRNGDVYVDGHIAAKPRAVQQRLWLPVYDSRYPAENARAPWEMGREADLWKKGSIPGSLVLDARDHTGRSMASYGPVITDSYGYNGGPPTPVRGDTPGKLGDLRITAQVKPLQAGRDGAVVLQILEDTRSFTLSIPVKTGSLAVLEQGGRILKQVPVQPLKPGSVTSVNLQNWDNRVSCSVGGETIMSWDYTGDRTPRVERQEVEFGGQGAKLLFRRVRVYRDIYYLNHQQGRRYRLDEDQYFVLGDNSPQSKDSRFWPNPFVPGANLVGRAFLEFWPIHRMKLLSFGAGAAGPEDSSE